MGKHKLAERWTLEQFSALKTRLAAEGLTRDAKTSMTSWLLARLGESAFEEYGVDEFQWRLTLTIRILEQHPHDLELGTKDVKTLFETGEAILRALGISPSSSTFSHLYADLHQAYGRSLGLDGNTWAQAWHAEMSRYALYRPDEQQERRAHEGLAEGYLRLGHISLAVRALEVSASATDGPGRQLLRAHCLRLAADDQSAAELLAEIKFTADQANRWQSRLDWEKTWIDRSSRDYDAVPPYAIARFKQERDYLLLLKLWTFAAKRRTEVTSLAKVQSIKRKSASDKAWLKRNKVLLQCLEKLETCYDSVVPMTERLASVGECLSLRSALPELEHEMLFLAALGRFLVRHSHASMAELVLEEYKVLSLKASQGLERDVLKLFTHDRVAGTLFEVSDGDGEAASSVVSGKWQRRVALGGLVTTSVGVVVSSRVKSVFARESEKARIRERAFRRLGEEFYGTLGQLKGGLMKVGQLLSYAAEVSDEFKLPLSILQAHAAPHPAREARQTVESELGKPIAELFAEWGDEPLFVGSIGQVHRARLPTGEVVAVKVQHPGVDAAMEEDLKAMGFFMPLFRYVLPKADHDAFLDEIKDRLREELNYVKEAENQELFRAIFAGDDAIVIPKVHTAYSTARVLTSDFIEGESLASFVMSAPQEEKNRAGETILRQLCVALFRHGVFNGDPQPANFLFLPEGRVAFVDFGAVRRWTPAFVAKWLALAASVIDDDAAGNRAAWQALGYDQRSKSFDFDAQFLVSKGILAPIVEPGPFRFTKAFQERLSRLHLFDNRNLKETSPPPESALLIRIGWGLVTILIELEAEACWRDKVVAALKGDGVREGQPSRIAT